MKPVLCFVLPLALLSPPAMADEVQGTPAQPRFVMNVIGDVAPAAQRTVLDALESNYARISADLTTTPVQPFNVYFYAGRWAYSNATGNWGASGSIEGTSKLHLLPTSRLGDKAETVAVHEFAHAVVLKLLVDHEAQPLNTANFDSRFAKFPVWLWEAIAVYEAKEFTNPKRLGYITRTTYPSLDELNDRSKGSKAYKVGYTIVEYIRAEYGQDGLIKLILAYGNLEVLKTTKEEFAKGWHGFVVKKYF